MSFNCEFFKTQTSDGKNFELIESVDFRRPNGEVITIPTGSKSDGASTPRILWREFPPFGKYWRAAYLHDHLYRNTERTKDECDKILLEAMESCGVSTIEEKLIYDGVRLGGASSFKEDREELQKKEVQTNG